ncbi:MAG: Asp-tRNA(Asn)/Glu-tRNA(Gln) amidotransferase subunit GatA [Tissierellia bacterium]|nr:Asp-tRNA(Asn)/Glu-tRNA(Gln) amidotransferase subunit GatA [Tissierellia bacterium]
MSKIKQIQNLLEAKEISCVELTKKYLSNIEEKNKEINAYVNITEEEALKTAKLVDEKIATGEKLMPLEGIPMSLKDNISTKNIKTSCCSKMLKDYVPIYDATVWEILKKQNSILLGKTNMDEFAMGASTESSYFGVTLNPHNTNYVAGGSSGGAAASVAGGLAAFGLATDTGGSIRQPASFCGLVGFKPSYGSVSRYGAIAYASSLDQIGPITDSVEDAAIVYDSISIYDSKDSTSVGSKNTSHDKLNSSIKGIKIGVVKEYFEGLRDDIRKLMEDSIKVYQGLGAEIVDITIPLLKANLPVYFITACAEASSNMGRYDGIRYGYKTDSYNSIDEMICKNRSESLGKEVQRRIMLGTYALSSDRYDAYYKKAQKLRACIRRDFKKIFEECSVILTPTAPTTAYALGQAVKDPIETYSMDICTVPANIAGLPAISVPCGLAENKLPVGMQLIGNRFEDYKVLNIAYQYEKETKDQNRSLWQEVEV